MKQEASITDFSFKKSFLPPPRVNRIFVSSKLIFSRNTTSLNFPFKLHQNDGDGKKYLTEEKNTLKSSLEKVFRTKLQSTKAQNFVFELSANSRLSNESYPVAFAVLNSKSSSTKPILATTAKHCPTSINRKRLSRDAQIESSGVYRSQVPQAKLR